MTVKDIFMKRRMAQIAARYEAGRAYAKEEMAALAGMLTRVPEVPEGCEGNSDFEEGYYAYLDEPDGPM